MNFDEIFGGVGHDPVIDQLDFGGDRGLNLYHPIFCRSRLTSLSVEDFSSYLRCVA